MALRGESPSTRGMRPRDTLNGWLVDGGADYDLVPKKISCTLRIRNLLDTKSFQTIENTAILYSENSYHLLPRMILIGIKAII